VPSYWQPIIAGMERQGFGILLVLIFIAPTLLRSMVLPIVTALFGLMPGF
jgi:hypothetical protein